MADGDFKVYVVGASGSGKTPFVIMFTQNFFIVDYDPTIEEELGDEIDDPIVSDLMDESTNPIYVYNSDNIDDEIDIDEEDCYSIYRRSPKVASNAE